MSLTLFKKYIWEARADLRIPYSLTNLEWCSDDDDLGISVIFLSRYFNLLSPLRLSIHGFFASQSWKIAVTLLVFFLVKLKWGKVKKQRFSSSNVEETAAEVQLLIQDPSFHMRTRELMGRVIFQDAPFLGAIIDGVAWALASEAFEGRGKLWFSKLLSGHKLLENQPKCLIEFFQFWHFPPSFIHVKLTCLVTLFDC